MATPEKWSEEFVLCNPTWAAAAHIHVAALEYGSKEGKQAARDEIFRMGRMIDALLKRNEAQP